MAVGAKPSRWSRCGALSLGFPRVPSCVFNPGENPPGDSARRDFMSRPARLLGRAAWISTAMGSSGLPLASGHLASFDRRKCTVLWGPTATGQHCPEGWTLYPFPRAAVQGRSLTGIRRSELLHLGRSAQHVWPSWPQYSVRDGQCVGSLSCVGQRSIHGTSRSLSHGLLRQGP